MADDLEVSQSIVEVGTVGLGDRGQAAEVQVSQSILEVATHDVPNIDVSQDVIEVAIHQIPNINVSQTIIEVAYKLVAPSVVPGRGMVQYRRPFHSGSSS